MTTSNEYFVYVFNQISDEDDPESVTVFCGWKRIGFIPYEASQVAVLLTYLDSWEAMLKGAVDIQCLTFLDKSTGWEYPSCYFPDSVFPPASFMDTTRFENVHNFLIKGEYDPDFWSEGD